MFAVIDILCVCGAEEVAVVASLLCGAIHPQWVLAPPHVSHPHRPLLPRAGGRGVCPQGRW